MAMTEKRPGKTGGSGRLIGLGPAFLVGLAVLYLLPFFYGLFVSLIAPADVMARSFSFPWPPRFSNFTDAWTSVPFGHYFLNSLVVSLTVTAGSTFTGVLAAYVFARAEFRGRDLLFYLVVGTLMIPGHITLIPNYLTMARLHLLDSYWALALPFLANGFSVFFLRQYMRGIPRDVEEAARLDGAGLFKVLTEVIVPMSMPAIAAISLFTFLSEWNSFIWPLIATSSDQMRTVQIGLALLYRREAEQGLVDWPMVMAGSMIVLLPTIIAFLIAERQLVRGISMGTFK